MPHIRDVFEMTVSYLCTKGAASGAAAGAGVDAAAAAAVASGTPPPAQQQQHLRDEAVLLHKALVNLDADSVWLDLVVRGSTRHAKCGFKKSCLFKILCTSMH